MPVSTPAVGRVTLGRSWRGPKATHMDCPAARARARARGTPGTKGEPTSARAQVKSDKKSCSPAVAGRCLGVSAGYVVLSSVTATPTAMTMIATRTNRPM